MRNAKYPCGLFVLIMCVQVSFAQSVYKTTGAQPVTVAQNITTFGAFEELHLGRYELYAGIPAMNIGHVILLNNGKYKVAFSTDEDNYDETGTYIFHPDTNTIEWTAGMFKNNNWGGKMVKKDKGFRIEFNKSAYAESKSINN